MLKTKPNTQAESSQAGCALSMRRRSRLKSTIIKKDTRSRLFFPLTFSIICKIINQIKNKECIRQRATETNNEPDQRKGNTNKYLHVMRTFNVW